MLIQIPSKDFKIRLHFHYYAFPHDGRIFNATECVVHNNERACVKNENNICARGPFTGIAYCHPNDQFSKAIGRKVALGKAIQKLPRSLRSEIWEAYFDIVGYPNV